MKNLLISRKDFVMILIGITILAIGVKWFLAPIGLVTGGVSGLGILVENVSQVLLGFTIPISVTNLACNLPLFLVSIPPQLYYSFFFPPHLKILV